MIAEQNAIAPIISHYVDEYWGEWYKVERKFCDNIKYADHPRDYVLGGLDALEIADCPISRSFLNMCTEIIELLK